MTLERLEKLDSFKMGLVPEEQTVISGQNLQPYPLTFGKMRGIENGAQTLMNTDSIDPA